MLILQVLNIFIFIHYVGIVNIFIFDIIHVVIIIIIGGLMETALCRN